jgi:hypothetical protein
MRPNGAGERPGKPGTEGLFCLRNSLRWWLRNALVSGGRFALVATINVFFHLSWVLSAGKPTINARITLIVPTKTPRN